MEQVIKIKLDADKTVRFYYREKVFWIFYRWVIYRNIAHGSHYDAYVTYEKECKAINLFFKPKHK